MDAQEYRILLDNLETYEFSEGIQSQIKENVRNAKYYDGIQTKLKTIANYGFVLFMFLVPATTYFSLSTPEKQREIKQIPERLEKMITQHKF
ncbi:MAG: hypothetical protein AABX11_06800 [Nanoarchaeota archaeon]